MYFCRSVPPSLSLQILPKLAKISVGPVFPLQDKNSLWGATLCAEGTARIRRGRRHSWKFGCILKCADVGDEGEQTGKERVSCFETLAHKKNINASTIHRCDEQTKNIPGFPVFAFDFLQSQQFYVTMM